jgi:hypothetical protein
VSEPEAVRTSNPKSVRRKIVQLLDCRFDNASIAQNRTIPDIELEKALLWKTFEQLQVEMECLKKEHIADVNTQETRYFVEKDRVQRELEQALIRAGDLDRTSIIQAAQIEKLKKDHTRELTKLQDQLNAQVATSEGWQKAYNISKRESERDHPNIRSRTSVISEGASARLMSKQLRLDVAIAAGTLTELYDNYWDMVNDMKDEWGSTFVPTKYQGLWNGILKNPRRKCLGRDCTSTIEFNGWSQLNF